MVRLRPYAKAWLDSGKREPRVRSAALILGQAFRDDRILPEHRVGLIDEMLWSITEADGKYTARFRSRGVLELEANGRVDNWRALLRHDHVLTRKTLSERIRGGEDIAAVLNDAIACVVTKDEHDRLSAYDRTHSGWDRYRAAGIVVIDMATGEPRD